MRGYQAAYAVGRHLAAGIAIGLLHGDIALPGAVPAADLGELLGAVAACLLD